jgi:hypothetical protein
MLFRNAPRCCAHPVYNARTLTNESLALTVRALRILLRQRRNLHHVAVIWVTTQPADEDAFEQSSVESICFHAAMLARYSTRRVDDVGFDVVRRSERASQNPSRPLAIFKTRPLFRERFSGDWDYGDVSLCSPKTHMTSSDGPGTSKGWAVSLAKETPGWRVWCDNFTRGMDGTLPKFSAFESGTGMQLKRS